MRDHAGLVAQAGIDHHHHHLLLLLMATEIRRIIKKTRYTHLDYIPYLDLCSRKCKSRSNQWRKFFSRGIYWSDSIIMYTEKGWLITLLSPAYKYYTSRHSVAIFLIGFLFGGEALNFALLSLTVLFKWNFISGGRSCCCSFPSIWGLLKINQPSKKESFFFFPLQNSKKDRSLLYTLISLGCSSVTTVEIYLHFRQPRLMHVAG